MSEGGIGGRSPDLSLWEPCHEPRHAVPVCHNGAMTTFARSLGAAAAVTALALTATACSSAKTPVPTTQSTIAPTTVPIPTTTTFAIPEAPQPSAQDAASALVADWASGDMAKATTVATSVAVSTLFADPYPNGLAINRGCSTGSSPITCTFGPPGGGPTNDPIFQIMASQLPAGWYVSSVQILG
jgi:hypothetical protein